MIYFVAMTRVFKIRHFSRWMRKTGLSDSALCVAVVEMERGLIDADLGGGVVKKRVALPGRGVVGCGRWLRRIRVTDGSSLELEALQKIAADLLKLTSKDLDAHL